MPVLLIGMLARALLSFTTRSKGRAMSSFFEELKRRNVVRVALAYMVAAWLAMQVIDVMFPALNVPEWVASAVAILLIVGFPFALIVAWAFEITPEGLKREKDVDRSRSITARTGRTLNRITIAILVAAVGFLLVDKFVLRPEEQDVMATAAVKRSVAVLPFVNMSDDKENDYFSDGLAEELLNVLAKVPQLQVAGRTSSFQFKGENEDLRLIGQKLNVANVIEGSVRKSGARLRITAQLIDTENGYHLWSNTYDRELTDVFAVQDEIASEVAQALKVTLLGDATGTPTHGTTNVDAYNLYLQAMYFLDHASADNYDKADDSLQQAIALDPSYADAWALRSIVSGQIVSGFAGGGSDDFIEGFETARALAKKALELDPELPMAYIAQGVVATVVDRDLEAGVGHFSKALELAPNDVTAVNWLLSVRRMQGRDDELLPLSERLMQLDPLSIFAHRERADVLAETGHPDEAISIYEDALRLQPDAARLHGRLAQIYLLRGEFEQAAQQIAQEPVAWEHEQLAIMLDSKGENTPALQAATQASIDKWGTPNSFQYAEIYAYVGDADNAFRWLNTAWEVHDPGFLWFRRSLFLPPLHDDPRWAALEEKLGH
jgi:TolB-like protein/predicted Zn-dependent protease